MTEQCENCFWRYQCPQPYNFDVTELICKERKVRGSASLPKSEEATKDE